MSFVLSNMRSLPVRRQRCHMMVLWTTVDRRHAPPPPHQRLMTHQANGNAQHTRSNGEAARARYLVEDQYPKRGPRLVHRCNRELGLEAMSLTCPNINRNNNPLPRLAPETSNDFRRLLKPSRAPQARPRALRAPLHNVGQRQHSL